MVRLVLDTNQVIRALMRPPALATFVMSWQARRFTVVGSAELLAEYSITIANPSIAILIYPELLRTFNSQLLHDIEVVRLGYIPAICRDPDDDKVIATAIAGLVDYLVTEDQDLLTGEVKSLLLRSGVQVISATHLIQLLDQ